MRVIALLLFSVVGFGAKDKPVLITWNVNDQTLSWANTLDGKTKHVVDFRTLTMSGKDGKYHFSVDEKLRMLMLFNLLTQYAVESEMWYQNGGQSAPPQSQKHQNIASR